jgi:hypothetical protein
MSKIPWWVIGVAVLFALYFGTLMLILSRSTAPASASGVASTSHTIVFRTYDIFDFLWPHRVIRHRASYGVQTSHAIGLAMYSYANDNGGKYPTGKSSTEIFQQLVDGGYVSDPKIFYFEELHVPGKHPAMSTKLKPENICWDVTTPLELTSDPSLPLLFITGFKMNYVPGGSAVPRPTPTPSSVIHAGIYIFYVNNSAMFRVNDGKPDEIVPNVVDPSFKPSGKTYIQLSPDGPVP